jgi:hypothetical protein
LRAEISKAAYARRLSGKALKIAAFKKNLCRLSRKGLRFPSPDLSGEARKKYAKNLQPGLAIKQN